MKNKLKNYLKLGILLFGVSIFIISCQKDDDLELIKVKQTQPNFLVTKVGKIEIEANKVLKQKLSKLDKELAKHKTSNLNKTVYSSTYDFYVDTDYATYIENADATYHSYTFPILRTVETDSLENLLISLKPDGSYKTMIIIYATTALEKQMLLNGLPVDLTDKITQATFNDNGFLDTVFSKTTYCDDWDTETYCYYNNPSHPNGYDGGEECPGWTILVQGSNNCHDDSGGSWTPPPPEDNGNQTNTNSNDTNNNQQGSGGTNNNTTDTTYPTGPCQGHDCPEEFDPIHDKNCAELGKLINNPATTAPQNNPNIEGDHKSTRIAILNCASQLGQNFEYGYGFYNENNFPQYGPYAHNIPAAQDNHVYFPGHGTQYGTVHSHPNDGVRIPMFSHDDMYSLLHIKNQYGIGNITPDFGDATFVSVLVVYQGTQTYTYAIKIEDPTKLLNLDDYKTTDRDWEDFGDEIREAYNDDANGVNGSATAYQKTFLNLVKDLDLGISLYKMKPNDLNEPSELETWEKLSLDNNGNLANPKPCN